MDKDNLHRIKFGPDIQFGNTIDIGEQLYYLRELGIPEDLHGKKVLELFSGGEESSFLHAVQERGGEYHSIDSAEHITNGTHHTRADVYEEVRRLIASHPQSFDYIIIKHPPIWGKELKVSSLRDVLKNRSRSDKHNWSNLDKLLDLLTDATQLIKPVRGNSISLIGGSTREDMGALYRNFYTKVRATDWTLTQSAAIHKTYRPQRDFLGRIVRNPATRDPIMEKVPSHTMQIIRK